MLKIITLIYLFITLCFSNMSYAKDSYKIIVKVDNEIVSNHDIKKEKNYLSALNPEILNISEDEFQNPNIVKVSVNGELSENTFLNSLDFFRTGQGSKDKLYHHIGIYAFTNKALIRYVTLKRTKLELERKLEQLRALENNMSIHVGYIKSSPLSVDTEEDFIKVKKIMEK